MNEFAKYVLNVAKRIQADVNRIAKPPPEGRKPKTNQVIDFNLVKGTRGYIERTVHQINGTYENGWYDACAVMLRRLIETLIIEVFEKHNITSRIKDDNGNFYRLNKLITKTYNESTWTLENNGEILRKLKDIGNWSAHKRRYNTNRHDIDQHLSNIRLAVQELIYLAGLK